MKKLIVTVTLAIATSFAMAEDAYVQSLGTSFMNTGYRFSSKTKVEVDFAYADVTEQKYQTILGAAMDKDNENTLALCTDGGFDLECRYGVVQQRVRILDRVYLDTERHTAVLDFPNHALTYATDGTVSKTVNLNAQMVATNMAAASLMPLALFSAIDNANGTADKSWTRTTARIYGCKIYESGVLVRDYVPCKIDGIFGFRDKVSGAFIYGNDSSAFTGGGDIADYEPPYIESLGTSVMNTRHRPSPKTKVEVDFAYVDTATKYQRIIDNGTGSAGNIVNCGLGLNGSFDISFWYGDAQIWLKAGYKVDTVRHTAMLDFPGKKLAYCTGGILKFGYTIPDEMMATNVTKTAENPLALFSDSTDGSGVTDRSWTRAKARIYRCRIWEDGALVHDYVPCVKDGIAGFKDAVDGYFICGEDVTGFTYGGDIERIVDDGYVSTPNNMNTLGLCGIDTLYKVKPNTKLVLDYALLKNPGVEFTNWAYLLDASSGGTPMCVYAHGSNKTLYYAFGSNSDDKWKSSGFPITTCKNVRRQLVMDSNHKVMVVSTGNYTNKVVTVQTSVKEPTSSDKTLMLCAPMNLDQRSAALKIYGFKIYESDELVYDYKPYVKDGVPGLYDSTKDSFVSAVAKSGINQLMAGGNIEGLVQDAYLESDGTGIIKTDYVPNANTKIVADYMILATNTGKRVAGYENTANSSSLIFQWYVSGNYLLRPMMGSTAGTPNAKIDFYRHVATMDGPNKSYSQTGAGVEWSAANGGTISGECDGTLGIFGYGTSPDWSTFGGLCKMRLYSLKIYESGELIHQYLPYDNGTALGLKDTVTGKAYFDLNGSTTAFTMSGYGVDGSGKGVVSGMEDGEIDVGKAKTITAFAPGAKSYVWTVDGEESATTTDTISVAWRHHCRQIVVTCTPIFSIDGTPAKGTTSTATYTLLKGGLTILVK